MLVVVVVVDGVLLVIHRSVRTVAKIELSLDA
jgi:hypothetical protein